MKATVEAIDAVHKSIHIEIAWDIVANEIELAYKDLAKNIEIKGFRKGKIPRGVLEQRYRTKIENEVTARLLQESYETALIQQRIQPVARPELEKGSLKQGEPFQYIARVEVIPEIELNPYKFTLERPAVQVEQTQVQATLNALREQKAVLVPIEDRNSPQDGDTLVIEYTASDHGRVLHGGEVKNAEFTLGSNQALPGFEEHLRTLNKGQSKEFDLTLPESSGANAGKTLHFRVTLHSINKRELPELNDEFAKVLGRPGCETLSALEADVHHELLEQAQRRSQQELKEKVGDQLVAANPIAVPPTLLDRQQEILVQEAEYYLARQGMDPRQVGGPVRNQLKQNVRERAEREVRLSLLLGAVAFKDKITVADADLEAFYAQQAARAGQNIHSVRASYQDPQMQSRIKNQLLYDKVLDYLLSLSNIKADSGGPAPSTGTSP